MRGRAFAFAASRLASFREARTHCRTGNGIRFLETKQVAASRIDNTFTFVRNICATFDFNQLEWGRGRDFSWDQSGNLHVLDGASAPPGESFLRRQIQLGLQIMTARLTIIRGFNVGWVLNVVNNNQVGTFTFGGFIEINYAPPFQIPFPASAPNGAPGDGNSNLMQFDNSPEALFPNHDLIGWPP